MPEPGGAGVSMSRDVHWSEIEGGSSGVRARRRRSNAFPPAAVSWRWGATWVAACSLGEIVEQSGKQIEVIGVDTCRGSGPEGPGARDYHGEAVARGGGTFAGELHANIVARGYAELISLMVADSVTASGFFADESLDWVHIDARHEYASVKADIAVWLPKIRTGGWLSSDDYDERKWPEVVRAVDEALPEAKPWSTGQWRVVIT